MLMNHSICILSYLSWASPYAPPALLLILVLSSDISDSLTSPPSIAIASTADELLHLKVLELLIRPRWLARWNYGSEDLTNFKTSTYFLFK
jgi:hypothetical protein